MNYDYKFITKITGVYKRSPISQKNMIKLSENSGRIRSMLFLDKLKKYIGNFEKAPMLHRKLEGGGGIIAVSTRQKNRYKINLEVRQKIRY